MGETIEQAMKRRDRLLSLYNILGRQKEMLDALHVGRHYLYESDADWFARWEAMAIQLAHEVVLTCEAIWELSGPQERAR